MKISVHIEPGFKDISNFYATKLKENPKIHFYEKNQLERHMRMTNVLPDEKKKILSPAQKYTQEKP